MKFSLKWLAEYLPAVTSLKNLENTLTDIGLEVEEDIKINLELSNVVVGKIVAIDSPPDIKLKVCTVAIASKKTITVLCGANNIYVGMYVPTALDGAVIQGKEVTTRKIAKINSQGVLCSEAELNLGDDNSGIMDLGKDCKEGQTLTKLLELKDRVIDVAITPNRGDWLSIYGIAREIAAKTNLSLKKPNSIKNKPNIKTKNLEHKVTINKDALVVCPKFTCMPITDIDASQPTPALIAERLKRCGVRPISIVVDITNYVMLELGQPLHAFDRDKLSGNIVIRYAKENEKLTLLDETKANLKKHILVVADEEKAQAVAGVMGGLNSGVTNKTTNVLLEAAHFVPKIVRGRTRELNINSEAAFRFERGVDPNLPELAVALATKLIKVYCGGNSGKYTVAGKTPKNSRKVKLDPKKISAVTGIEVSKKIVTQRLKALGFGMRMRGKSYDVTSPSWRFDIEHTEDLIEEIVRLGGYDAIPTTMPKLTGSFLPVKQTLSNETILRDRLVALGFNEIVSYAFVDPKWESDFYANDKALKLSNPLSPEQSVMRSGLIGGLMNIATYNEHRQQKNLRLFEIGKCFLSNVKQPMHLAGLVWGPISPDHWDGIKRNHDYFDLRGIVETILPNVSLEFKPDCTVAAVHPNVSANIYVNDKQIGFIGEIHPALLGKHRYDLNPAPVVFELDLDYLQSIAYLPIAKNISKLPLIRRDLALLISDDVLASKLIKSTEDLSIAELIEVEIFDNFANDKVGRGMRSIGLRLTLQGLQENLVDERIKEITSKVTDCLVDKYNAKVRD